jgi:hypothetical protein
MLDERTQKVKKCQRIPLDLYSQSSIRSTKTRISKGIFMEINQRLTLCPSNLSYNLVAFIGSETHPIPKHHFLIYMPNNTGALSPHYTSHSHSIGILSNRYRISKGIFRQIHWRYIVITYTYSPLLTGQRLSHNPHLLFVRL